MPRTVYEIDGARFSTLAEFYDEVGQVLIPGADWGRNLDAFNDILRGGFGTPDRGFELVWKNHERSRSTLGHLETARYLEIKLAQCHATNREHVRIELENAKAGHGPTLFDILVEIVQDHGNGGEQAEDRVILRLE